MKAPSLSVVIPAYNEEERLPRTLERVISYLGRRGEEFEILVVDDGSTDRTSEVALSFSQLAPLRVLRNEENRGKGYSVRRGMLAARGSLRLFTDADLSTPIEELPKLERAILEEGFDVAIASRGLLQSKLVVRQPFWREILGRTFNLYVQALLLPGIWDTQCGFKLFTARAAEGVFRRITLEGFGFDFEALYVAKKLGFKIKEVPVLWLHSPKTKVKVLRDGLRMGVDVLKVKANDLKGIYDER
ncbi:MAG TPA: glycosyltransferase family 2 protein [Armatimonadetes bacterium]|nr:glycosyltransferase family 2 protein [Armatimonadota bacterium]